VRAFDVWEKLLSAAFAHILVSASQASKLLLPLLRSDVGEWNLGGGESHFEMTEALSELERGSHALTGHAVDLFEAAVHIVKVVRPFQRV